MYAVSVATAIRIFFCKRSKWFKLLFLCCSFWLQKAAGQNRVPCNEITADMGFTVRSVRITGRWVPEALRTRVEQIVGVGQPFNPANVSAAQEAVRTELVKGEENMAIPLAGATSALFITSDVCDVSDSTHPKEVAVTIRPYYLRIDLFNVGNNILPVPRSAKPTFYERVPAALLATAPWIGLLNDRNYGSSLAVQTTTDLLNLPSLLRKNSNFKKLKLNLDLNARLSFTEPFHDLGAGLSLARPVYSTTALGWNLGFRYAQNIQPLAKGEYHQELARVYGGLQGSGKSSFLNKYAFGGGVRFLQNKYAVLPAQQKIQNPERTYEWYALGDGRLGKGFSRLGMWFNAGIPKHTTNYKSYQQVAGRFGYAITLGNGHNNVDLETTLGSGYTWGTPPPYNQFFAGNTAWNFLYEPFASVRNVSFPAGAVVRSLGEREGGLRTATGAI
ncbi:MAG: hypothetical protein ICV84_00150, partial [Flavisolibacter sp.]|nr:hypothetical protein [Flavisolibacter sp.]